MIAFRNLSGPLAALAMVCALTTVAGSATAGGINTTTAITGSTVNPSDIGQNTTLTATVTPLTFYASCSGTVAFLKATTPLVCSPAGQTISTSNGGATYTATCTTSFSASGPQSLTARYLGPGACYPSLSAAFTQNVNVSANVPTLGGWGLFLLIGLMLGVGLIVMSRRNRASAFPTT